MNKKLFYGIVIRKIGKSNHSDKIFNYVKRSDASGSIILLHETQAVVDALPRIIEYLQAQDLEFVNLQ